MDHRDKLLSIVKEKGPLLPAQINHEMKTNVLFASAMLSEMVDQKKLRLTSMKVGGSPLYYCEGQEAVLENFAHKLPDADFNTFQLLKKNKILKDKSLDPQMRVSLREITDFAVPLEVTANSHADLFWKYYLVPDAEAKDLIRDYLNDEHAKKAAVEKPKEVQSTIEVAEESISVPADPAKQITSVTLTQLDESQVPEFSYETAFSFSTQIDTDEKIKIEKKAPPLEESQKVLAFPEDDKFFKKVSEFFDGSGIEISDFSMIKKGSEYDFVVKIPSNVGSLNYYCKAKNKAKISDADLSTAFVYGQVKKLPILFLTNGELHKKAEELLSKEFKSMFVKKI